MRMYAILATVACLGAVYGGELTPLKATDTAPPCFPQHVAGPDKGTNTCPV